LETCLPAFQHIYSEEDWSVRKTSLADLAMNPRIDTIFHEYLAELILACWGAQLWDEDKKILLQFRSHLR